MVRGEAEILNLPSFAAVAALREGELLLASGDHRAALVVLTDAEPQLSDDLRAVALARSSEALLALGMTRQALDVCARGIELVERDRDKTSAAYMQGAYLRRTISLYANGVRAAHERGDSRALTWMELSKGRTLPPMRDGHVPEAVRERFAELGERIDRCRDPEAETALRLKRRALFDRMLGAQRGAREAFDLAAVQAALAPGQRALSYYWLDGESVLLAVITHDEVVTEVRTVPDVDALAAAVVRGGEVEYHVPTTLLDRLLEPLANTLLPEAVRGAERLLVSPHRLLHTVPFLALPFDGRPLVRSMAVATIPNLTCLQAAPPAPPDRRMLAVGVNEYAAARTLRHAEEAASEIAALYAANGYEARALLGPDATESALRGRLDTPPAALHLTLHGASVESDTPLESWLLLGRLAPRRPRPDRLAPRRNDSRARVLLVGPARARRARDARAARRRRARAPGRVLLRRRATVAQRAVARRVPRRAGRHRAPSTQSSSPARPPTSLCKPPSSTTWTMLVCSIATRRTGLRSRSRAPRGSEV